MKWDKYTIKTITDAEDILSAVLDGTGVEGVQIEDKIPLSQEDKEKMFIDILPVLPEDDGVAYISFFLEHGKDNSEILSNVRSELDNLREFMDIGEGTINKSVTDDADWINNWKEFFKPFSVDDIYIKPTWEEITSEARGKKIIEIDPQTAFGTGQHETTQLCIRLLRKYIDKGKNILDVGCGSGILSIVSIKEGAAFVHGIDVDENAVKVSFENAKVNKLEEDKYNFVVGNLIADSEFRKNFCNNKYDIVVANIFADIIISLTSIIPSCLKSGGIYISSGIINTKEEDVIKALKENGFKILEVKEQGDWRAVAAQKQ